MTDLLEKSADTSAMTIQLALHQWKSYQNRMPLFLESINDAQYESVLAPTTNSVSWIAGHLAETHDGLFPLLGIGGRLYPKLSEIYLHDKKSLSQPHFSKDELILIWNNIHNELHKSFDYFTPATWLDKHTAVPASDFIREPHRNKLNVLMTRTNHLAYHLGQLVLVKNANNI
jgi:hypothetical protein